MEFVMNHVISLTWPGNTKRAVPQPCPIRDQHYSFFYLIGSACPQVIYRGRLRASENTV